jgi:hypothetical protein
LTERNPFAAFPKREVKVDQTNLQLLMRIFEITLRETKTAVVRVEAATPTEAIQLAHTTPVEWDGEVAREAIEVREVGYHE